MAGDRTMNDDLDEPQFEHEEPAAQNKKRTKKNGRATTTTTTTPRPARRQSSRRAPRRPPNRRRRRRSRFKRRAGPRRSRGHRARRRATVPRGPRGSETSCRTRTRPRCRRAAHLPKAMSRWRWRRECGAASSPVPSTSWSFVPRPGGPRTSPGRSATTRRSDASSSSSASTKIGRSRSAPSRR